MKSTHYEKYMHMSLHNVYILLYRVYQDNNNNNIIIIIGIAPQNADANSAAHASQQP